MEKNLKVLMIGSDRNLFTLGSAVAKRAMDYGDLVGELHIIVFSDRRRGFKETKLGKNVWVYPTNALSRWFRPRKAIQLGKRLVRDKGFVRGQSVITTQDPFETGIVGLKIKRKWRLPLEVQLHTDPFSPYFSGALNNVRRKLAVKVLKEADRVRVVTTKLKDRVATHTHADVSVLPIYVDKSRIEGGQITFDVRARYGWHFTLLSVSRLEPEKDLGTALQVLARVREKFPDTGLILVGSGSEEGRLKALAKKLGLEHNTAFAGWQDDLASFYRTSNAYIQTSKFEGYGLSLVEAGISGLPILTTPVGLAEELEHGKDAYIYPVGAVDLFAKGVIDLLENNLKRENLKMNMKGTLENKLLSKEAYMAEIKKGWEEVATRVSLKQ